MISPKFNRKQTTKTSMQGEMVKGITVLRYKLPYFRKVNEQKTKQNTHKRKCNTSFLKNKNLKKKHLFRLLCKKQEKDI